MKQIAAVKEANAKLLLYFAVQFDITFVSE